MIVVERKECFPPLLPRSLAVMNKSASSSSSSRLAVLKKEESSDASSSQGWMYKTGFPVKVREAPQTEEVGFRWKRNEIEVLDDDVDDDDDEEYEENGVIEFHAKHQQSPGKLMLLKMKSKSRSSYEEDDTLNNVRVTSF